MCSHEIAASTAQLVAASKVSKLLKTVVSTLPVKKTGAIALFNFTTVLARITVTG